MAAGSRVSNQAHFNPLPPCGGRRKRAARAAYIADFNPLPPCGGRPNVIVSDLLDAVFQSTPSVWRETLDAIAPSASENISIHSLRVEGDIIFILSSPICHISIHSLRVEGDHKYDCIGHHKIISIHSLRVEEDNYTHRFQHFVAYFNPLPPCGGRHRTAPTLYQAINFNPLPPCGGRPMPLSLVSRAVVFQSTPSVWRETLHYP